MNASLVTFLVIGFLVVSCGADKGVYKFAEDRTTTTLKFYDQVRVKFDRKKSVNKTALSLACRKNFGDQWYLAEKHQLKEFLKSSKQEGMADFFWSYDHKNKKTVLVLPATGEEFRSVKSTTVGRVVCVEYLPLSYDGVQQIAVDFRGIRGFPGRVTRRIGNKVEVELRLINLREVHVFQRFELKKQD